MGDRSMCPHTYDMVCINEWGDDSDDVECRECPHYNGGKDVYGLSGQSSEKTGQERFEEGKNRLYLEALEWWDRLTPMEKIGIRKVIKNVQGRK